MGELFVTMTLRVLGQSHFK